MNKNDLIRKIANGDKVAFRQLFDRYHHFVYNICYRMGGNREEAQDTTQDVFIKIFQSIADFRGDAKLSTWIYRITVNTCLKKERRKKLIYWVSLEFLLKDNKRALSFVNTDTPEQQLEKSENEKIIQQAIQMLPARQKTALILYRYENLSYKEIAQIMRISLSAVESLLHRSRKNLAQKLIEKK